MAAETNTTVKNDMARVQSIDFATQFNGSLEKLFECLGITRKMSMASGGVIKTYKYTGTIEDGNVAEGDIIPLSKIKEEIDQTYEIGLKKYRRQATAEAIQASGFDKAVTELDGKLLKEIYKSIRSNFFDFLGEGTGTAAGSNFQTLLANVWGQCQVAFEDDAVDVIAFANPLDAAEYLGNANITVQDVFGMKYLTGFTDVKGVFLTSLVSTGTIYGTAADNIVTAYIDVSGELSKAFSLTKDESGYVGVTHTEVTNRAAFDTVAFTGVLLFAERLAGVISGTIEQQV